MGELSLIETLEAMAQLYGRQINKNAVVLFVEDLRDYPAAQVKVALQRCRKELRVFPTVADIIARIDDGHPGAEEAWASIPRTESESVVWTKEMAEAFGVALPLMDEDKVAARMAFLESYRRLLSDSRAQNKPAKWEVSLGHDPVLRKSVLSEAADRGRISRELAFEYLVELAPASGGLLLDGQIDKEAVAKATEVLAEIRKLIATKEMPR